MHTQLLTLSVWMEQTIKQRPERADVFTGRTENVDVFSVAMATRTDAK